MLMHEKKNFQERLSLNEEICVPHFQPIISVVTRQILGYEVLGRVYQGENKNYISLGAFFHSSDTSFFERVQVDRIIREKAIRYLKNTGSNTKLFFNLMPSMLSNIHQEEYLDPNRFHLIQLIEKYNIDKNNIVIEITEEEFNGKIERLVRMVDLYRSYGFKIAIDDVGAGFSNLERIGYIHPDIIKVDIKIMRESLSNASFRQVLLAISEMTLKLGSELLFEGIENESELNLAFSMGASLLQGFYFAKPQLEFQNKDSFKEEMDEKLEKFSGIRFLELVEEYQKKDELIQTLNSIFHNIANDEKLTEKELQKLLYNSVELFPEQIKQFFIVDIHGYQVSSTFIRHSLENFDIISREIGNNHAWKPFFIKHKANSYFYKRSWDVTQPLYDIQTQKNYVIYTYNLTSKYILVVKVDW